MAAFGPTPLLDGQFTRPNVFEIDLGAIAACTRELRATIGPNVRMFATLKANAYGYGLLPVARTVLAAGADALTVGNLESGVALRKAGIMAPIVVFAGNLPSERIVRLIEENELMPTLHDQQSLDTYARYAKRRIQVAVKVDVGAERIGVAVRAAAAYVQQISRHPQLELQVLNAHPAVPTKGRIDDVTAWQYQLFMDVLEQLERLGIMVPYRVFASTKVIRRSAGAMALNAVDPGAGLFASATADGGAGAQAFRALKSRLIQVRDVARTEYSEEAPFKLGADIRIGVIPLGYSDAMNRLHCGEVIVRGRRVPIAGEPSMEYTRIDLTGVEGAMVGDEVVIIGTQGGAYIAPDEVVLKQNAGRVANLAMEMRPSISRVYLGRMAQDAKRVVGAEAVARSKIV